MSKTFSEKVFVNVLVYKCPIFMFAVFPLNDHVHDIKYDGQCPRTENDMKILIIQIYDQT